MIDAVGVLSNALWVLGLALMLAVFSWAHWMAGVEKKRFSSVLSRSGVRTALDAGLAIFCAGLAATSHAWWERLLWWLLAAWRLVCAGLSIRRKEFEPVDSSQ